MGTGHWAGFIVFFFFFMTTKIGILLNQVNITSKTSQRKRRLTYWHGMGMHGIALTKLAKLCIQ